MCHAHGFAWACVGPSPLSATQNATFPRMPTQSRGHGTQNVWHPPRLSGGDKPLRSPKAKRDHRMKTTLALIVLLSLGVVLHAQAPCTSCGLPSLQDGWLSRKCWCPDDYDSKSLPCVAPNCRGCCDDYCPKPVPCVTPNCRGCCDDYCRKACPTLFGIGCGSWYQCGPSPTCTDLFAETVMVSREAQPTAEKLASRPQPARGRLRLAANHSSSPASPGRPVSCRTT